MSLEEAQEAALEEHNRLRALHEDTEPLELCAENLACGTGMSEIVVEEAVRATKSWYDELEDPGYDYENPGFNGGTGHFTQVNG